MVWKVLQHDTNFDKKIKSALFDAKLTITLSQIECMELDFSTVELFSII